MPLTVVFLLLAAGALRIIPAFSTQFWYDEVMSLMLAREAGSIAGVLRIPYDNNHILNGITLFLTADAPHWGIHRIPAVLFGTLTVLLAWMIARERSRLDGLIALLLFGISYPLVLLSSEARGYAALAFFSLAAFVLAQRWLTHPHPLTATLFVLCSILGFLSHITFAVTFACLIAFLAHESGGQAMSQPGRQACLPEPWRRQADARLFNVFVSLVGPVVFALLLLSLAPAFPPGIYLGSAQYSFLSSLREAATVPLGFPPTLAGIMFGSAALIIVSMTELHHLKRERNGEWLFFSAILLSSPVILAQGAVSETWGTRYLLVPIVFFLLLLARFIARLLKRRSRAMQCIGTILLVAFVFLNGMSVLQLIAVGRGRYLDALRFMAQNADASTITVGSNATNDPVLIRYYGQFLPQGTRVEYVRSDGSAGDGTPEWYIVSDYLHIFDPGDELLDVAGATYRLEQVYRYHRESGQNWFLYRKGDRNP